jgi:AcrR family transcriptional regulator
MVRWEPGARDRLAAAAFELFAERGFEQTTVTDIAARAGLDKRTFYRLFGDKREALFSGGKLLEEVMVAVIADVDFTSPLTAVIAALDAAAREIFADRLEFARARQQVIAGSTELMERESLKMASLADALATALRDRGVGETAARLAAESGVTVFRLAFARWIAPGNETPLADLIAVFAAELRAVAAA